MNHLDATAMPNSALPNARDCQVAPTRFSEHLFGAIIPATCLLLLYGFQTGFGDGVRGVPSLVAYVIPAMQCLALWTWILAGRSVGRTRLRLFLRDSLLVGCLFAAGVAVFLLRYLDASPHRGAFFESIGYRSLGVFLFLLAICVMPFGTALVFWRRFREAAASRWPQHGWSSSAISVVLCFGLWVGLPIGLHLASTRVAREAVVTLENGWETDRSAALSQLDRWNLLIHTGWMLDEWRMQKSSATRMRAIEMAHQRLTGHSPDFYMD